MRWRGAVLAMVALLIVTHSAGRRTRERKHSSDRGRLVSGVCACRQCRNVHARQWPAGRGPPHTWIDLMCRIWSGTRSGERMIRPASLAWRTSWNMPHSEVQGRMGAQDALQSVAYHSAAEGEAFTSYDYTAYYHVVPRERLATVMQLEANRMAALSVSYAALVLEQEEIVEERRAEIDDVPEMRLDLHLRALLYDTHPYGVPVLGWPEEVARLTPQDVITFHHTWYAPNNAMLIIAGDITATRLVPLVHQYYGGIPARDVPTRQRPHVSAPPARPRLVMQEPHVRTPVWQRSYRAPSYHTGETQHAYALHVLGESWQVRRQVGSLVIWWDRSAWPQPCMWTICRTALARRSSPSIPPLHPGSRSRRLSRRSTRTGRGRGARRVPHRRATGAAALALSATVARHTCPGRGGHPGDGVNYRTDPGRRGALAGAYCGSHPEPRCTQRRRRCCGRSGPSPACCFPSPAVTQPGWCRSSGRSGKETSEEEAETHAGVKYALLRAFG